MFFWHYTRIFAHLLSLSVEENSIIMKLYLQLGLCIALSLQSLDCSEWSTDHGIQ